MHADIRFIDVPGFAGLSASLDPELIRYERGKARFPVSNGLMGELKAPLQEHLRQIPQTQLVPQPPENDEKDDISGIFQKVEGSPRALVEGTSAV
jgi:hypothetical protein